MENRISSPISEILDRLNEQQRKAVKDIYGPKFVVACPGAGKTASIIARTQYMILNGINPESILLFTFTNKAAKEIKQRVGTAIGYKLADKITTGTYHSFCCRLLRKYGDKLGYKKGWSIYDSEDSKKVVNRLVKGTAINASSVISYISLQKRNLKSPAQSLQNINETDLANMYDLYQKELMNDNAMDFDDLIYNVIKLLKNNIDVKSKVNNKYKYIVSDEFQDSASSDIELIRLLGGEDNNICFVLDLDQSIYSFRGANMKAILNVRNIYPDLTIHILNQNYRSTKNIVNASRSLINNNPIDIKKDVFTDNKEGDKIIYYEENNPSAQALRIVKMIRYLVKKKNYSYSDIAILYRTSNSSRIIEDNLLKYNIPYEVLSGVNFYQRKEVKDILAFARLLGNHFDFEAFNRIVNIPKRGIGEKTINKVIDVAKGKIPYISILKACDKAIKEKQVKGKTLLSLTDFYNKIIELDKVKDTLTVQDLLKKIIKTFNYYNYLKEDDKSTADERILNVMELIDLAGNFNSLDEFLSQTCLDRKEDEDNVYNKVHLLTMHMSKGLEWKVVFLVDLNEGTIPHFRSLAFPNAIEEERRIFYVAMTRAEELLFLFRPKVIKINGYYSNANESRFIGEIDKRYLLNPNDFEK